MLDESLDLLRPVTNKVWPGTPIKNCVCIHVGVIVSVSAGMSEEVMPAGQHNYSPWWPIAKIPLCVCARVSLEAWKQMTQRTFDRKWCHRSSFTHTLRRRSLQEGGRRKVPGRSVRRSPGWWGWRPAGPPIPAAGRFLASLEVSGFSQIFLFSCPGQAGHLRVLVETNKKRGEKKLEIYWYCCASLCNDQDVKDSPTASLQSLLCCVDQRLTLQYGNSFRFEVSHSFFSLHTKIHSSAKWTANQAAVFWKAAI